MGKAKKLITNWRVIVLLVTLLIAIIAISPRFGDRGIAVRHVAPNSAASIAGIENPVSSTALASRERIVAVNGDPISSVSVFYDSTLDLKVNDTVVIKTNKKTYLLTVQPIINTTILNETEFISVLENVTEEVNGTNVTVEKNVTKEVQKVLTEVVGSAEIGLQVFDAPSNNLKQGLDLQGGTRVLLKPEEEISEEDFETLKTTLEQRLNVFGLSDIKVAVVRNLPKALGGIPEFLLVEIAGANIEEVQDLLARQGKFEAKVMNTTVFIGGNRDVVFLDKGAGRAGIDPGSCGLYQDGNYGCRFFFGITLSDKAARKFANTTKDLAVATGASGEQYLEADIELYLDDVLVDSLKIGSDLKGQVVTQIRVSGSGLGISEKEARANSIKSMKELQSVLETGSLPVKLEIVKADTISPVLGQSFIKNALWVGLLAILGVAIVLFIRYRKLIITVPMIITVISEVTLVLGVAALIGWNLDLAAIAGIIIVVGSGIDHQIVIIDETLNKEISGENWKSKLKKAFVIIMGAYATTIVALIPLLFAGAGLLKGFALTTGIGVTLGVLITRPAFAAAVEVLLDD
jgi:preprotein translocase subunit SecD